MGPDFLKITNDFSKVSKSKHLKHQLAQFWIKHL